EQCDQPPIGPALGRESDAPPTREEQQPRPDRPVEPRQTDIRPERLRRAAIHPIAGANIGAKLGHAVVLITLNTSRHVAIPAVRPSTLLRTRRVCAWHLPVADARKDIPRPERSRRTQDGHATRTIMLSYRHHGR